MLVFIFGGAAITLSMLLSERINDSLIENIILQQNGTIYLMHSSNY